VVELKPEPAVATVVPEPVAEQLLLVEAVSVAEVAKPAPVAPAIELSPIAAARPDTAPVIEPLVEAVPESLPVAPVVESAAAVEPAPVAIPEPELIPVEAKAGSVPVDDLNPPVTEAVADASTDPQVDVPELAATAEFELTPVADQVPVVDLQPAGAESASSALVEPTLPEQAPLVEANTERVPVVDLKPAVTESAAEPERTPIAETASFVDLTPARPEPVPEPSPANALIQLQEVPDPFLALAEEIRAVQAVRAAALAAPAAESGGLLELAEAVGTSESTPVSPAEVSVQPAAPAAPGKPSFVEAVATREAPVPVEAATAIALLEAPPRETALLTAAEPAGHVEPQSLAPEPQPVAIPEPAPGGPVALQPSSVDGPNLPLAPMQNYTPATSRSILPVPPRAQILAADSGPRITLPGPTLPPELTRLQEANFVNLIGEPTAQRAKEAIAPRKSGGGAQGWFVTAGVMLLLLAAALGVIYYPLLHTIVDAKTAPTPAVAAPASASTAPQSPLAKFIEVTGYRIVIDQNKKSEVQYLVVNHSSADISDANIFITLHSVKPGQPPVCRFSFKVPSLAPFESKEMSSPIEKTTRAVSLPDWQDLRADVQISQ
jgi:hypothetical protein